MMGRCAPAFVAALVTIASMMACGGDPTRLDVSIDAEAAIARVELELFQPNAQASFAQGSLLLPTAGARTSTIVLLLPDRVGGEPVSLFVRGYDASSDTLVASASTAVTIERGDRAAVLITLREGVIEPLCGDGLVDESEACDDTARIDGDGCSASCTVEQGWICAFEPSVCRRCGNGVIEARETCDDGNINASDGCSKTCAIEAGWACIGAPSSCAETCGNHRVDTGEGCDDGNTTSRDGCSASCAIETGYACVNGTSCAPICGDGRRLAAEACDDGDTANGDGCSSACTVEPDFTCTGSPSTCSPISDPPPPPCGSSCNSCTAGGCCAQDCNSDNQNCDLHCAPGCDCELDCSNAETCNPECREAACKFNCAGAKHCKPKCNGMGTTCEITCDANVDDCDKLECRMGAACMVSCNNAEKCGFMRCDGGAASCAGDIEVCNRPCP